MFGIGEHGILILYGTLSIKFAALYLQSAIPLLRLRWAFGQGSLEDNAFLENQCVRPRLCQIN